MFNLVKEGEPIFSKDFCEFFKIKNITCRAQFLKFKVFKDYKIPSLRNIALGLSSVITAATGKHEHEYEC